MATSANIPAMFGRVWTGPPEAALWDMYENDVSFDEASQNVMNDSMSDSSDIFGEQQLGDDLEGDDPDALEKAIYQINVATDNGSDPSGIMTPYGPGLGIEEIGALVEQYPGIESGLDLGAKDDYFSDADFFVKGASDELDAIIDAVEESTEREGRIGEEPGFWGRIGEQLASVFDIEPAYASDGLTPSDSPIQSEDDAGVLDWFGSVASNIADFFTEGLEAGAEGQMALAGAYQNIGGDILEQGQDFADGVFSSVPPLMTGPSVLGAGFQAQPGAELNQLLDLSPAEILENLRRDETPYGEITDWMNSQEFDTLAAQGGNDPSRLRAILESMAPEMEMYGRGIDGGPAPDDPVIDDAGGDQGFWGGIGATLGRAGDIIGNPNLLTNRNFFGLPSDDKTGETGETDKTDLNETFPPKNGGVAPSKKDGPGLDWTPRTEEQIEWDAWYDGLSSEEKFEYDELVKAYSVTQTAESAATNAREKIIGKKTTPPKTSPTSAFIASQAGAPERSAGTIINENLRKVFYSKMYARPEANRWDVQKQLPTLFSQTKTLFFLHEGRNAWDAYGKQALDTGTSTTDKSKRAAAQTELDSAYKKFLGQYLANPLSKRAGWNFKSKLSDLSIMLGKSKEDADAAGQIAEWSWADANFGDTAGDRGVINRDSLVKLNATQGSTGYYSDRIHSSIDKLLTYYRNMGEMTEPQILAHMTKSFSGGDGMLPEEEFA